MSINSLISIAMLLCLLVVPYIIDAGIKRLQFKKIKIYRCSGEYKIYWVRK